ncbi:MAG: sigma-54 dependent transcriptional regulator [Chthoniobacteraceae bacterium]
MPVEKIMVVDDEPIIRKSFEELLRPKRYSITSVGSLADAERLLKKDHFDLLFLDVKLPDGTGTDLLERLSKMPEHPMTIMMSGYGTVESAVDCMRQGAFDYMLKPFSLNQIEVLVKKAESYGQVMKLNRFLNEQLTDSSDLIGDSEPMVNLKRMLRKVAPTDATVLIQGENGTGKELIAREIYHASNRSQGPYIKVNCAAISETLIETEFFGHEKGSFTGATERREGRFELANGGTLLLDEVSEITPKLQAKLLRVLQEQEFERVGGTKTIKVDVRVLATTNRDLKKAVANGDFREDLYYRLHVFPLQVPPLRERVNDIARLANHFLQRFSRRHGLDIPGYSQAAMDRLLQHSWPGNVRELQNMVERAVIMTENGTPVQSAALGLPALGAAPGPAAPLEHLADAESRSASSTSESTPATLRPLDEVEKEHILRVLEAMKGNRTQAANVLQISIRTLRNKLNEYRVGTEESAEAMTVEES